MAVSAPRLVLVDKSAFLRAELSALEEHGEPCLCSVTRLEILYSARHASEYAELSAICAQLRDLRMDAATFTAAESVQAELARAGRHRVSLPDLLIAACAQQHVAAVLHVDRHFDVLGPLLGIDTIRLAGT